MKIWIYIFLIAIFNSFEVYGARPKPLGNNKTSCTIVRTKFTQGDLVEYRFGVVAGQNVTSIKSKGSSYQDAITRFAGGLAAQIIWPKGFTLQPEILYSQKGCIFAGSGAKFNVDYVEIPVKAMYRLQITDVKPFAFVSPYVAYAIKMAEEGKITSNDDILDNIFKLDYGIGVGAGFDVWILQVSFRYSWGFAKVIDDEFSVRNKAFTVSAGIFF